MRAVQLNRTRGYRWYDCVINDMEGPEHRQAWVYAKSPQLAAVYLWKESNSLVDCVQVMLADDNRYLANSQIISAYTEWEKRATKREIAELDAFVQFLQ